MRELWIVYKDEMTLIVFIGSLIFWAVVVSILAFKNKTQVILIGNKGGSYQLIKAEEKKPFRNGKLYPAFLKPYFKL